MRPLLLLTALCSAFSIGLPIDASAQGGKARRLKGPGPFIALGFNFAIPTFDADLSKHIVDEATIDGLDAAARSFVDYRLGVPVIETLGALKEFPKSGPLLSLDIFTAQESRTLRSFFQRPIPKPADGEAFCKFISETVPAADALEIARSKRPRSIEVLAGDKSWPALCPTVQVLLQTRQADSNELTSDEVRALIELDRLLIHRRAIHHLAKRSIELNNAFLFGGGFFADHRAFPSVAIVESVDPATGKAFFKARDGSPASPDIEREDRVQTRNNPFVNINVGIARSVANELDYGDSDVSRTLWWFSLSPTLEYRFPIAKDASITAGAGPAFHLFAGEMLDGNFMTRFSWRASLGAQWRWLWFGYQTDYFPGGFNPRDFGALGPDREGGERVDYFPYFNIDVIELARIAARRRGAR